MKKLFLLLALLGMVAVGCSKDEGGRENNIPENIFFGLDKESATISPDGGSVDVIVYSNYKWEISGISDWCTPSVKGGDANEDGQKVTFSADVAYDDRETIFWFRCADEKIKFVVSQKLKEVIIPDANNAFNIPAEGGVAVISYQTSVDCKVIIPKDAQSWITIAPATRGLVSESITLNIAENTTYNARTAVIKVVAKDNAELAVEYTINQEQNDAVLANGNTEFTIDGREQQITIKHKANVDCEVIIPDEAQDWVAIAPATRGLSTYSTTLNIAENNSGKDRNCVVKVVSQDNNELFAEYTITQNPRYSLYYTSSNGEIVQPYDSSAFGATILSNTYKDGVGVIEFDAPITTIGERAFYNCSSLTSVTIPDSVTMIGEYAFNGCSSLTGVYISDIAAWCNISFGSWDSNPLYYAKNLYLNNKLVTDLVIPSDITEINNYAFNNCSSLTSITIPDSVTTIGVCAFYGCSSLTSITIPDSVTTIGVCAFYGCSSLTSVTIPDSVTTIGYRAFENCESLTSVTIGDSVTTIGVCAFYGCSSLTSITIPDSVTTIGDYAFSNCSSLTSVTIGSGVTTIGYEAFVNCTGELVVNCNIPSASSSKYGAFYGSKFTSVTIGDGATEIGDYAFSNCSSLTSVTIPDSVTTIGDDVFSGCSSLTSVTIPDSVTSIGEGAFENCSSLTSVTIGDSVTTIGMYAFRDCSSLTSVTIPDSVTTIGWCTFYKCSSLTSVTIGNSVTSIGDGAFRDCSSLTSVTIPDSVTTIGYFAFEYCSSLTSVYCKATTPPAGGYCMFSSNASGRKIYVPMESVDAYKSAEGWSEYKSYIVGYNF